MSEEARVLPRSSFTTFKKVWEHFAVLPHLATHEKRYARGRVTLPTYNTLRNAGNARYPVTADGVLRSDPDLVAAEASV